MWGEGGGGEVGVVRRAEEEDLLAVFGVRGVSPLCGGGWWGIGIGTGEGGTAYA